VKNDEYQKEIIRVYLVAKHFRFVHQYDEILHWFQYLIFQPYNISAYTAQETQLLCCRGFVAFASVCGAVT
jgi:hypothetical protein